MGDITSDWYRATIPAKRKRRNAAGRTSAVPLTRRELDERRVARAARRDSFVAVEHGVYVPRHVVGDSGPDALTLVRAHAKRRPGHVATGFAAAAAYGMRYFCDDELLEFLVPKGTASAKTPCRLRYRRSRRLELYRGGGQRPDGACPEVICAAPEVTYGHLLDALDEPCAARDSRWRVPDLRAVRAELSPEFIRQVQVSDAFHQAMGAGKVADAARVRGTADAAAVLAATDVGAESPPETLLRLVLADLAPGCRSQIPVWDEEGKLLTTVDLGWDNERVFVFYDGAHHLQRGQRDHDSRVLAALQRDGGRVFRVTAGAVKDPASVQELREMVAEVISAR